MFCFFFSSFETFLNFDPNAEIQYIEIQHNGQIFKADKRIAVASSQFISSKLKENPNEDIVADFEDEFNDFYLIEAFLLGKFITICTSNIKFIKLASEFLKISFLLEKTVEFEKHYQAIVKSEDMAILQAYESVLFALNKDNFENISESFPFFSENNDETDIDLIAQIIYRIAQIKYLSAPLLFRFAKLLNKPSIGRIIQYLVMYNYPSRYDLTGRSIDLSVITEDTFISKNNNFKNYLIQNLIDFNLISDIYNFRDDIEWYTRFILDNEYEILTKKQNENENKSENENKKTDLEANGNENFNENVGEIETENILLKIVKLRREGVNPSMICGILRNDDVDQLQEFSGKDCNFNFSQYIPYSPFESSNMLCKCTLIEYASFFSSVKCFRFLQMNGAEIKNAKRLIKYAIAGGNIEIIRLCEQNECLFYNAARHSIRFHKHQILEWLLANKVRFIGADTICTFSFTQNHYSYQKWYECETCNLTIPLGCCQYCAMHCHKKHNLIDRGYCFAFCDCGSAGCKGVKTTHDDTETNEVNFDEMENVIIKSVKYCNFGTLLKLVEQGADFREICPKFFIIAASYNNHRLAKIALSLGKPNENVIIDKIYDKILNSKMEPGREIKQLTKVAYKMGIISIERECTIY